MVCKLINAPSHEAFQARAPAPPQRSGSTRLPGAPPARRRLPEATAAGPRAGRWADGLQTPTAGVTSVNAFLEDCGVGALWLLSLI